MTTSYDALRYPGQFYPQASPERMATLAMLFGLTPPDVANCRVLELGCGEGANLIPLAEAFPRSRFEGLDLAQTSVLRAKESATKLRLANVDFRVQDVTTFSRESGTYDYIIAHGLYSWVPDEIRHAILEICCRYLAPKGLAYISYNALPGGYLRRYARDIMRFHTRFISDPQQKATEARKAIQFVLSALKPNSVEAGVITSEMRGYEHSDAFLYHDLLTDESEPIYFVDFMEQAGRSAMQFLAEADPGWLSLAHLPDDTRQGLAKMRDRLMQEQYRDFIQCRRFRQTILCRAGHELRLDLSPERLSAFFVGGSTRAVAQIADYGAGTSVEFRTLSNRSLTCSEPLPKALYAILGELWPKFLSYDVLFAEACERARVIPEKTTAAMFANAILSSYSAGILDLRTCPPNVSAEMSDHPVASGTARLCAENQSPVPVLHRTTVGVLETELLDLLLLLDGTCDRGQLLHELALRGHSVDAAGLDIRLNRLRDFTLLVG